MWAHHRTPNSAWSTAGSPPDERVARGIGDERARDLAVRRDLEHLGQELGRDDAADHAQDQERVAVERQPLGLRDQPPPVGPGDREQDDHRDDVLHRADRRPQRAVERDREDRLDQAAGDDVRGADREQHEAPEDPRVEDPGLQVAEHPRLHDPVAQRPPQARGGVVGGARVARGREHPQVARHRQREERRRPQNTGNTSGYAGTSAKAGNTSAPGGRIGAIGGVGGARRVARRQVRAPVGPCRGVVERPGQRLERVVEQRDDDLERLQGAARRPRHVDDQAAAPRRRPGRATGRRTASSGDRPRASPRRSPGPRTRAPPTSPAASRHGASGRCRRWSRRGGAPRRPRRAPPRSPSARREPPAARRRTRARPAGPPARRPTRPRASPRRFGRSR